MLIRLLAVCVVTAAVLVGGWLFLAPGDADWDGAWVLTSGTYDGVALALDDRRPITLVLDGDTANGQSACNYYGAGVRHTSGGISFDSRGSTAMLCRPPSVMDLEAAYHQALYAATRAVRDGDILVLIGDRMALVFKRTSAE